MANVTINEISQNYTYSIGSSSFAAVALPITSCWGDGFFAPSAGGVTQGQALEGTNWSKFSASRSGLESFVSTYRGPAANYRLAGDYSYQTAMTLLSSGYDVLVCRLCPGGKAEGVITFTTPTETEEAAPALNVKAKYPGSFGNNLECILNKVANRNYWQLVVYVIDGAGIKTAAENLTFVFDVNNATDTVLHYSEVESNFITITLSGTVNDTTYSTPETNSIKLTGGDDRPAFVPTKTASAIIDDAITLAKTRFGLQASETNTYVSALTGIKSAADMTKAQTIYYREWLFTNVCDVYDLLTDKFSYRPQRIISSWDDIDVGFIDGTSFEAVPAVSPIAKKLMDVAYNSRCATACIDIPKSLPRSGVYNDSSITPGYAQKLARSASSVSDPLYPTHSSLFVPWGQYTYVGMSRPAPASPSFLGLMIERAMLLNQAIQYEWALPTNRKHNLAIGKLDYKVSKKQLDEWQKLDGVGVNIITELPDLGVGLWGNSTLYDVPPATYQALANRSTRYLVNAIEDTVYRVGLQITWQYNNEQAYSTFYAGVTPILDTMKNVGAIEQYKVQMSSAIDGLDSVNANTVVGAIYITVNGVINDIIVDLVALPSSVDLERFGE